MNHKLIIAWVIASLASPAITGQSTVDSVLSAVLRNNKALSAGMQYMEAKRLEYSTGLSLPNPTVQYEYLFGSPSTAGDQQDFLAIQSFDFPSAYKRRRDFADQKGAGIAYQFAADRQEILVEAKSVCIELVFQRKLKSLLDKRLVSLQNLVEDFQKKLDQGDGNIMDVNKAKLQLLQARQERNEAEIEISGLATRLVGLNGGEQIFFTDTVYPVIPEIPAFELLEQDYELYDPVRKGVEQEKKSAESQLAVLKATNLPKFEVGYRYQGILGQRFNGVHAGITLPLWEQQNKVEHQEAEVFYSELQIQEHLNEHFYEIRQLYDLQVAQASILQQYRDSFADDNNLVLLDKALRLGQISVIEYFLETSFYYHTTVQYLETERDYHITLCNMFKYKL